MSSHARRQTVLRSILAFSILSTAGHFAHNFVKIDQYPDDLVSGKVTQVAILISWPLLTAIGLLGYRWYTQGRYPAARAALLTYSFLGISTLGHFLDGSPDIAPFWYATIFTDALAGTAILAFAVWATRPQRALATSA